MAHLNIVFITVHPFRALCPFLIYSRSFRVEQRYCFAAPVSQEELLPPDVRGRVLAVSVRVSVPNCMSRGGSTLGLLPLPSSAPAPALPSGQDLARPGAMGPDGVCWGASAQSTCVAVFYRAAQA